jgi:carbonic anhydrase
VDRLYKGIYRFQRSYFKKEEEFFKRLSRDQNPEVLFITCADARVDPNLVTQSKPGDLFIVRNVGNIIPPYDAIRDKNSVAAAIEFAVLELRVADIIICGHSNCGAIQTLFQEESDLEDMPHLRDWIRIALPVKEIMDKHYAQVSLDFRNRIAEKENILAQLRNIQTYPFVAKALEEGKLYLHGWYYDIGTGNISSYNPVTDTFEMIG